MDIQTTRFGQVQCIDEDIIHFPEGLLGFASLNRFILLDDSTDDIFAWLQSCDEAAIAFPVLEPELFNSAYKVGLSRTDLTALGVDTEKGLRCFTIITIPQDPTQMTANLKAPLVINIEKRLARQCILQDNSLAIREPIFSRLQQRFVQNPKVSVKPVLTNERPNVQVPRRLEPESSAE